MENREWTILKHKQHLELLKWIFYNDQRVRDDHH
jgi:hypothetical protein